MSTNPAWESEMSLSLTLTLSMPGLPPAGEGHPFSCP